MWWRYVREARKKKRLGRRQRLRRRRRSIAWWSGGVLVYIPFKKKPCSNLNVLLRTRFFFQKGNSKLTLYFWLLGRVSAYINRLLFGFSIINWYCNSSNKFLYMDRAPCKWTCFREDTTLIYVSSLECRPVDGTAQLGDGTGPPKWRAPSSWAKVQLNPLLWPHDGRTMRVNQWNRIWTYRC